MPSAPFISLKIQRIIQRNFIISLYSIWETYIKNKLYDVYMKNEDILYNEEFIKKYFEKTFSKKYTIKIFMDNISDAHIKKEILFDSNNLSWYEFENFINAIGFDISRLKSNLTNRDELDKLSSIFMERGITPLYNQKNNEKDIKMKRIVGYIQLIVENRNQISHNFDTDLPENINKKKALIFIHFIKVLTGEIEQFIEKEIALKLEQNGDLKEILEIVNVIKGCNMNIDQTCIVEVHIPQDFKELPKDIYIKSETGSVKKAKIIAKQYKGINLSKIINNKIISIEIQVDMKIKTNRKYSICTRKSTTEKMKLLQTSYDKSKLSIY